MSDSYCGKITLILGPMFSGKTSEMIRLINRAKIIGRKILCIKYYKDNRFSKNNIIYSRDNTTPTSSSNVAVTTIISNKNLISETIKNVDLTQYDMIFIDEIQFYVDGAETCDELANKGFDIVCSGLQGTFERKTFETISKLISLSEDIIQLKALDINSKCECSFTKRINNNKDIELIGNEEYIACDRKNYFS